MDVIGDLDSHGSAHDETCQVLYWWGEPDLDDDDLELYTLRWIALEPGEDWSDRWDRDDLDGMLDLTGVDPDEIWADGMSHDGDRRARFIRSVADYLGGDYVDDGPELFDRESMELLLAGKLRPGGCDNADDVSAELALINRHRRRVGVHPLDPGAAGWNSVDVRTEARRLRALGENPRQALLSW